MGYLKRGAWVAPKEGANELIIVILLSVRNHNRLTVVDFKNRELIKVMWLPEAKEVLLFINNEAFVPGDAELYNQVSAYIDIDQWKDLYSTFYYKWLNDDDASIYDITHEVNHTMINALIKVNSDLKDRLFFIGLMWIGLTMRIINGRSALFQNQADLSWR